MRDKPESLWLVTREYAGIAEAGGVKNVACSLAEGLVRQGLAVTVFIPRYGCVIQEGTHFLSVSVKVMGEVHDVSLSRLYLNGVEVILVNARIFGEKRAVYVYTEYEERHVPGAIRGKGHHDADCMNILLQESVIECARRTGKAPDVVHCQDAHTAVLPALARVKETELFSETSFAVTVHNAGPGYRQVIPGIHRAAALTAIDESALGRALLNGNVEPFLLSAEFGNLTTVSPWYARELTNRGYDAFTEGLSGELERRGTPVTGIVNGIDYHRYEPSNTRISLLPFPYDPIQGRYEGKYACRDWFLRMVEDFENTSDISRYGSMEDDPHAVYFSYHGRIVWQKGLDVLEEAARTVLDALPQARFIILGQGDPSLEARLERMAAVHEGRLVFIKGYERSLARLAVAVSDFLVLPSTFEPCGLEDYIGQIFGTIPVAHAVGGLQKIIEGQNGFLYGTGKPGESHNSSAVLAPLLLRLARPIIESGGRGCASVPEYREMMTFGANHVRSSCDWDTIIEENYVPFYRAIMEKAGVGP